MTSIRPDRRTSAFLASLLFCASLLAVMADMARADDTAAIKSRPGRQRVELWPRPQKPGDKKTATSITIGDWTYTVVKAQSAKGGVPWELIVTPSSESKAGWTKGLAQQQPGLVAVAARATGDDVKTPDTIPVIRLPQSVWKARMDADLQEVVGIHFHEYVSDDVARILFTLHKVPPDNADGTAPADYEGQVGTRIEATLLAPVVYSLDQSVVARIDNEWVPDKNKREALTASRLQHEMGHAGVSQRVFLDVLRGPQDWNLKACTGRRSHLEYYGRKEPFGRSWDGYQRNVDKLLTLRTSIALVPPTRWSMLLPIPPERVTSQHLQRFNDAIVLLGPTFAATDKREQNTFHAHHGNAETPAAQ